MLETNRGCELPCWWGITPGETSWKELRSFFNTQGITLREGRIAWQPRERYAVLGLEEWGYGWVEFLEQEQGNLVRSIRVVWYGDYYTSGEEDPSPDVNLWEHFGMESVFVQLGVPSMIYLTCFGVSDSDFYREYSLWLEYTDSGIAVGYSGEAVNDNDTGCLVYPTFNQRESFDLRLQSPGGTLADTRVLGRGAGERVILESLEVSGWELRELQGMSVQDFYEIFSQPNPRVCACMINDPMPERGYEIISPTVRALSWDEEDSLVIEMLATNGGCELPCWWGITPGVTSWEDVQEVFLSYGKNIGSRKSSYGGTRYGVGVFGRHDPYPLDYVIEHDFYVRDKTVYMTRVTGRVLSELGWGSPQHFAQDWRRYSLEQVLARFGPPSQVLILYYPYVDGLYLLGLVYDNPNMMIEYSGLVQGESDAHNQRLDPALVCPRFEQMTRVRIWLVESGSDFSPMDGLYYSVSLEEATGVSPHEFYEMYHDSGSQHCLEAAEEFGSYYP